MFSMMAVIAILFFGLSNLNTDQDFKALTIFSLTFLASFFMLMMISTTPIGNRLNGKNVRLWFFHPVTARDLLIYVPLGIGIAFLFSFIANNAGFDAQIGRIFAISGAGIGFLFILVKTRSILLPVLGHGFFNTIVILLKSNIATGEVLSSNPFPVPIIGVTLGGLNQLASESLFQILLVGNAEEWFKVLVMSFVLLSYKGKFDAKGIVIVILAGLFAVAMWAVFHIIVQSQNVVTA